MHYASFSRKYPGKFQQTSTKLFPNLYQSMYVQGAAEIKVDFDK